MQTKEKIKKAITRCNLCPKRCYIEVKSTCSPVLHIIDHIKQCLVLIEVA